MRIVARQIWWLQIVRIAIGCAAVCVGLQLPWYAMAAVRHHNEWRQFRVMLPGGILIAIAGVVFATYARLEWRPRGVAVAMTRRGLILKANGFRCPKLVAIKWSQIRGARYIAATLIPFNRASVSVVLFTPIAAGVLPTSRGGVVELGPYTIGLRGNWGQWHPSDVAQLICDAAADPTVRNTL